MFFSIVKYSVISASDSNHDHDNKYQWAHQRKMEFNPNPTKQETEVLFIKSKWTKTFRYCANLLKNIFVTKS